MNAEEGGRLVSLVKSLYPAQRFDLDPANTVQAWGFVLADVEFSEAHAAAVRITRRGTTWCGPGDIRREAAAGRHVLAPDADALLADVREVARLGGTGRKALHPVARAAYDAIGGAESIKRLDSYGLMRLRTTLTQRIEAFDRRVLDDTLPPQQSEHVAIATRIAQRERELTAPESEPADYAARAQELRDKLAEIGKVPE